MEFLFINTLSLLPDKQNKYALITCGVLMFWLSTQRLRTRISEGEPPSDDR